MNREFVCVPGEERSSFQEAVERLVKAGSLDSQSNRIAVNSSSDLHTLANLLNPFIITYIIVCRSILSEPGRHWTEPDLVVFAQKQIVYLLSNDITVADRTINVRHSMLSSDLLKNGFQSLVSDGGLLKTDTNNGHYRVDVDRTGQIAARLSVFAPIDWRPVSKARL